MEICGLVEARRLGGREFYFGGFGLILGVFVGIGGICGNGGN